MSKNTISIKKKHIGIIDYICLVTMYVLHKGFIGIMVIVLILALLVAPFNLLPMTYLVLVSFVMLVLYKRAGKGLLINRFTKMISMGFKHFTSPGELTEAFYLGLLNIPDKYLDRESIRTCTHAPMIRCLIRKINGVRIEDLDCSQNQEREVLYDGKKYTIIISYKKDRFLYEAAYMNKKFVGYLKTAYPKRPFYDVEIPCELILAMKK